MTCLYTAGYRAENLLSFAFELRSTLRARFGLVVPYVGVVLLDCARSAKLRTTSRAFATLDAVLGILGRRGKLATVHGFVTSNAQRQAIINVEGEVRELCQRLNVMRMNIALFAAMLAGVIVALENSFAPFGEVAFVFAASAMCCYAAFPYRGRVACFPLKQAFVRAKSSAMVLSVKLLTAGVTGFNKRFSAVVPALLRAPFGVPPVGANLERFAAHLAYLGRAFASTLRTMGGKTFDRAVFLRINEGVEYASAVFAGAVLKRPDIEVMAFDVLAFGICECLAAATSACVHVYIVAQHLLSVKYVAVALERWSVHTGRQPVLVDI